MFVPLFFIVDLMLGDLVFLVLEFAQKDAILVFSNFKLFLQLIDVHVQLCLFFLFFQYFLFQDIFSLLGLDHLLSLLFFILFSDLS